MQRNMSNLDRIIRVILSGIFAYLYFGGVVTGTFGIILLVLGAVFLLTSIFSRSARCIYPSNLVRISAKRSHQTGADVETPAPFTTMQTSEFQQILSESNRPLVVDFWAPWCAPCKMTKPILEKLAEENGKKVRFLPINVDHSQELLETYKVVSIPTVLAIRDKMVVGRVAGAQNEAGYRTIFTALAEGKEVDVPISTFERTLRLGAGVLFVFIGILTNSWILTSVGAIVSFLGIYDRCPMWKLLKQKIKDKL